MLANTAQRHEVGEGVELRLALLHVRQDGEDAVVERRERVPSGRAAATRFVPMRPPTPETFSTTTPCPRSSAILSVTMRTAMSEALAACSGSTT